MKAGATGDEIVVSSFELFVAQQYSGVLALVIAVHGRRDAEDIAQEAFLRAQSHWTRLVSGGGSPPYWVRRVALNLAVSRYRRWKTEARALARLSACRDNTTVHMSSSSGEVWEQVRQLPARQAQVIALHYVEELSTPEMAVVLGLAEGTIRALLHQARTSLARGLAEDLDDSMEDDQP